MNRPISTQLKWLKSSLPLSLVLTVRHNIAGATCASVRYAAILDLRSGQAFVATSDVAMSLVGNAPPKTLTRTPQYNQHAPAVAWEIARRALAPLRFLIPYPVYPEMYSDSNSSALVILWSLLGYCDAWFNCELPGIDGAGQRGHELGAAAVFARALGGCAYHTGVQSDQIVVRGPLDQAPYLFDGQTSVILGVDERIMQHYMRIMNSTLRQQVQVNEVSSFSIGALLARMYRDSPSVRWSLPLVPEG